MRNILLDLSNASRFLEPHSGGNPQNVMLLKGQPY